MHTSDALKQAFEQQGGGAVEEVIIDPRKGAFAIVRFADAACREAALEKVGKRG